MDDSLELPDSLAKKHTDLVQDGDEESSGDEDGGLDWTKLIPGPARPVIPKRGEKEFEPRENGGTGLQMHILDRARSAMFETLRTTRTISSKGISYGIWHPSIGRAHVNVARGIHFSTMGHSAPRQTFDGHGITKVHKRLELLPEEAIYLIERGALFCWKECDLDTSSLQGFEGVTGIPMSVQQAYAEMIGKEGLTPEKFQVYAYLRRLGYAVTRTDPPNNLYPSAPPFELSRLTPTHSIFHRIFAAFFSIARKIFRFFFTGFSWWKPLRISRWKHRDYASVYRSLRFLPSRRDFLPYGQPRVVQSPAAPYKIFYNVYKPSTPFKKTSPPHPDFQVVVINARTTPMPTFYELAALFDLLPELPPPLPRPKRQAYGGKSSTIPVSVPILQQPTVTPKSTSLQYIFPSLFTPPPLPPPQEPPRRPNPFAALKQGKKMVVIAVVDSGNISFFRFSQGAFEEWPMA